LFELIPTLRVSTSSSSAASSVDNHGKANLHSTSSGASAGTMTRSLLRHLQ
jgi:hypothetical protein